VTMSNDSIEYTVGNIADLRVKVRQWTGKEMKFSQLSDGSLIVQGDSGEPVKIMPDDFVGPPTYKGGPVVVTTID
jgi:hypothetical protein